ncbi:bacteriophage antitermination protein Q [Lelliottia nimipressuralis]
MTPQLREFARIELIRALADNSGNTKGQLQAFSENPLLDKNRTPRKPVHMVGLEGGREVKAENPALYVMETRSRRRPLPPITDNEFAAAPWRRAVNRLSVYEQSWLRYCYGFDLAFRHQTLICEVIWNGHQKYLPEGLMKKTHKRIIGLVWLAVQEVAAMNMNDTYKAHAGALLASRLGVSRATWCKVYAPHWQELKAAVSDLDVQALNAAYICRHEGYFDDLTA